MKRLAVSIAFATVATVFGLNALGNFAQPTPLKTIATVVVHAHHHAAAVVLTNSATLN